MENFLFFFRFFLLLKIISFLMTSCKHFFTHLEIYCNYCVCVFFFFLFTLFIFFGQYFFAVFFVSCFCNSHYPERIKLRKCYIYCIRFVLSLPSLRIADVFIRFNHLDGSPAAGCCFHVDMRQLCNVRRN